MSFSRLLVCCSLVATWFAPSYAQDAGGAPVLAPVATAMNEFVTSGEMAGAVTLVADERGIVHLHAAGKADVEANQPMSADAIFWIASMSKPVTGACVMMLVDEGKLTLDDPITKHLPEMANLKLADGTAPVITIRHLLTHTSGMAELKGEDMYAAKNLAEAAAKYAKVAVQFAPGSKWQYSQTSINTAARIVEVASGKAFDQFLQERLCEPLGMKDTTFYLSAEQLPRLAKSYKRKPDQTLEATGIFLLGSKSPTDRERMPAANGGLFSTASDYAKFCRMLLNEGTFNGKKILSPEAVKAFRAVHSGDVQTGFTPGNAWGVGCCVVREPQGVSAALSSGSFGHGGAYGTQAWIDPVKKRVYVLMVQRANFQNSDNSDVRRVFQNTAAAALETK